MTCGIAGSGKSTLAKTIVRHLPNFARLSGDAYVHKTYGLWGIGYPPSKYEEYLDEAQIAVKAEVKSLLAEKKKDVVLDLSFWNRPYREEYKALIEDAGGRPVLVFLDASKELLWERISKRRENRDTLDVGDERRNGDSALDISEEVFEMYWRGFERPDGEGEIKVVVI